MEWIPFQFGANSVSIKRNHCLTEIRNSNCCPLRNHGAKDPTGVSLATNFVWTFTTAPPPTFVSRVPANRATAVAVNTTVTATFSEAMNAATINGTTFTVTGPGATPVAGAVTYTGTTATSTSTGVLANSTLFTATITTGAKDPAGVPHPANFVWIFTTEPPPAVTATVLPGEPQLFRSTRKSP